MLKVNKYILLIVLFVTSCSPAVKNLDSQGKIIICFGDSITYGEGASEGADYPSYLQGLLHKEVINAGVSGDTTESALSRLERDVLEKNPYLVIVELGGNDFLRKVPKEKTLRNLEEIVSRIQRRGSIVALCDVSSGFIMSGYRRDFKRIAKKTGSIFIPRLLEAILDNPSLKFDYIHPNSEGYKVLAQKVCQAIKPYIK